MKALYCLSADPIHYGHIDTAERASKMFEHVFVGIGVNPDKKGLFSPEERVRLAQRALVHVPNVTISSFKGLAVDYARTVGASVLVRGSRNRDDFEYEHMMCLANQDLDTGLETVILPSKKFHNVSSSMLRAIVKEYGDVSLYTPLFVKQILEEKILDQQRFGLTGEMGVGKSYIGHFLSSREPYIPHIELDEIAGRILGGHEENEFQCFQDEASRSARQEIFKVFGTLNRKELAEKVFACENNVKELNRIMDVPVMLKLRQTLRDKKGPIIINCASLLEWGLNTLCNNNVIIVTCKRETQVDRLVKLRGIPEEELIKRQNFQHNTKGKIQLLRNAIRRDKCGHLWLVGNNSKKIYHSDNADNILISVLKKFDLSYSEKFDLSYSD